ncbi:hypothetical protein D3C75_1071270 [compost metagenome]
MAIEIGRCSIDSPCAGAQGHGHQPLALHHTNADGQVDVFHEQVFVVIVQAQVNLHIGVAL